MKSNKKITIGLFNDSFFPMTDGVTLVVDNYARRLSKVANVIVFVPKYSGKFDDSVFPYKVVRCASIKTHMLDWPIPLPDIDPIFKNTLRKYKLDIVHIHSPFTLGNVGLLYAKKHKIPCVASMHSQFKQDFKRAFKNEFFATKATNVLMKFFNKCDECWAVNDMTAKVFYKDYGYKTMPKVLENATDMYPVEDEKKAREYINKKYKLSDDERVLLYVGRINLLKNIMLIAESINELKKLKPSFKYKMLFVGDGQDIKHLKTYIKNNKLEKDIILCGKVLDRKILSYFYVRADLFVFPSYYDTSGIVRIEAASQKTPGIFLKGSLTASTVKDNINAYLTEFDAEYLAKKIIKIFSDEKKYNKISENAFRDLYINWDTQMEKVYDLYIRLINNKKIEQ